MNLPEPLLKAIDQIAEGLAKQRKRAMITVDGDERCRYRAEDGCKCALGMILPDELYSEELEGAGAEMLTHRDQRLEAWVDGLTQDTDEVSMDSLFGSLSSFQAFHDSPLGRDFMGRLTYQALLKEHEGRTDEALAAAIKEQLIKRAEEKYGVDYA